MPGSRGVEGVSNRGMVDGSSAGFILRTMLFLSMGRGPAAWAILVAFSTPMPGLTFHRLAFGFAWFRGNILPVGASTAIFARLGDVEGFLVAILASTS